MPQTQPAHRRPVYQPAAQQPVVRPRVAPVYTATPPAIAEQPAARPRPIYNPLPAPAADATMLKEQVGQVEANAQPRPTYNPPAFVEAYEEYQRLLASPAEDKNGRGRSGLSVGLQAAGRTARESGDFAQTLGALIGGGVLGLVRPKTDEEMARPAQLERAQYRVKAAQAADEEQRKQEQSAADVRLKNANATYAEARPDIEAQKRADAAAQRERQAVLANLRLLKGQKLDLTNPRHAALLQRAADAGVEVDPDSWNDAGSNLAAVDVVDPANPTQKRRQYFNKATGQLVDVGQSGYVAPVHPDTEMTSAQEDTSADRKRALAQGDTGIAQGAERVGIMRGHLTLAQRAQDIRLDELSRKELAAAEKLRADAEEAQTLANEFSDKGWYTDDQGVRRRAKWAVQKEEQNKARAEKLRAQLYGDYGYLWAQDGSATPQMTVEDFLRNHPSFESAGHREGDKVVPMTTGDIMQAARRYGITLTNAGQPQTQPSAPGTALPRRGAPRRAPAAGGAGQYPYTEADVRKRARDKHKDEEEAVKAARENHLIP